MKILITGVSGFVGTRLSRFLLDKGHSVLGVSRHRGDELPDSPNLTFFPADTTQEGDWQNLVKEAEGIINLAGASIFRLWNESYRKTMYESRILTTRHLVNALPDDSSGLAMCSTSAVGFYGDSGDRVLDESAPVGEDFLATLSKDWEEEAKNAEAKGARVILTRFGIVLGKGGGAMKIMAPVFKLGIGGKLGNGKQWFPWIHIRDLLEAMYFCLENPEIRGPVNFCAPNPVQNRELTRTMGRVLHRPTIMTVPGFMMKTLLGEFGKVLLYSQRGKPAKLLENGYSFHHPRLKEALTDIL